MDFDEYDVKSRDLIPRNPRARVSPLPTVRLKWSLIWLNLTHPMFQDAFCN